MDHHQSWYTLLPFYEDILMFFQENYQNTIVFNSGIMPENSRFEGVQHILAALMVFGILLFMSLIARFKMRNIEAVIVPSKKLTVLNFFEIVTQMLMNLMKDVIGHDYKRHVPVVGTLALFILFSNLLGLVPGFTPPTDNLNTTLACGLVVFIYFNLQGLRVHGIGHITHLANPIGEWWGWFLAPLLFPIEVVGLIVRPFSLAIRLAGNMIGDHKVVFAFAGVLPFLLPLPFMLLGLLVSVIQTAVFCILTCVYISLHAQEASH